MLKKISLTTTVSLTMSLVWMGLLPAMGGADPLPVFSYPNTNLDDSMLFCYMQTADGRMLDLRRLCGTQTNNNQMSPESMPAPLPALPPSPGDLSNLNGTEFNPIPNAAGLQTGNGDIPTCFIFDAQGRPCAPQS